jgi:putative endonuclease
MWYVYFLELRNGDLYVGSTNDLKRRFASHQRGDVISTQRRVPAILAAYIAVRGELAARQLERYFKSGSGKAFAKKRLQPCTTSMKELTENTARPSPGSP